MTDFDLLYYYGFNNYEETAYANKETNFKVRELNNINTFFAASSRAFRRGVVGTGFNIQSRTQKQDFDEQFTKDIKRWSKKNGLGTKNRSNCEITGRYYFESAQRQMADELAVKAGGFIVAHHYNLEKFQYGYKFELISIDKIDTAKHRPKELLYNGIQLYKNGSIKSIFIYRDISKTESVEVSYQYLTLVVDKWADIHQYSAVSPLKRVLEALEYIDNYKAKEMEGAGRRAETPLIIKTPYFKEIFEAALRENANKLKAIKPNAKQLKEFFDLRRLDKRNPKSVFTYVNDDEEIVETGKGVFTIYNDMYHNETQAASAAIGLSSYSTAGIMPSSYNQALRAAQDEENEFKIVAQDLIEECLREMIEYHLLRAIMLKVNKGLLKNKVYEKYQNEYWNNPNNFMNVIFMRVEKGHIDPLKTSKANTEDILVNKTKTHIKALAEKGIDYQDYLEEETLFELERLKQLKKIRDAYEKEGFKYEPTENKSIINDKDLEDE